MPYSAGTAYLQVLPSFRGIEDELKRQAAEIGKAVDRAVDEGLRSGAAGSRSVDRASRAGGRRAGDEYGGAFANTLRRRLTEAYKSFPKLKDPTTDVDKSIARLRKKLKKVLEVPEGKIFDEGKAVALVRRLRRELRELERDAIGDDRATHNIRQARGEIEGLNDMIEQARRSGREAGGEYGGAFSRAVRTRITTALRELPDVRPEDNADEIGRKYIKLRERLERLRDVEIGVDLDEDEFRRDLIRLEADMRAFARSNPTATVDFNIDRARTALRQIPGMFRDEADRAGGAFNDAFKRHVTQALRDLPDIEPRFDMTGAQFRLRQLKAQLAAISDAEIGVDLDAADAIAKLQALHAQLATIALTEPDIDVRTNAARAAAELFAVLQMAHRIDREDVSINVNEEGLRRLAQNTDIPIHRLGVLIALGASIGPALVPAAAAASVALAGLATAAGAAVAGVGVLVLGLSGVFTAVKALNTFQQDADKSAKSLAQSQFAIANATDSVTSAERNLANTRESVAYSNRRAARAVADAQDAVTDAVRDRRRAELALVEAIRDAIRADEDRRRQIRGTALDIRQVNLDIAEAKRELDKVLADPKASEEDREQARINYEQRVLQLDELTARQKELAEDQAKWNREGARGSDQVKAAQDGVAAANEKVADSQQALADAIESQHQQQRQGQAQVESATQSLAAAQRSLEQATVSAGVAGGDALDNLNDAMKNLSPAGQAFARFLFGLKNEFLSFRAAAEEGLLPGLQRSIEGLLRYAAPLERFISKVAVAMGDAFEYVVGQLEHPEWQRFFRHLNDSAVPAILGMVKFTEIFSRGLASLIVTLSAFNGSMGKGLLDWAEGFATWAEKLDESQGFQNFLRYVREAGPDVIDLLFTMFEFIKRLVIAAAPVGLVVVDVFTGFFNVLNALPLGVLTALVTLIALFAGTMLLLKLRQVMWNQFVATIRNGGRSMTNTFTALRGFFVGIGGQASGLSRTISFLGASMARLSAAAASARVALSSFLTATMTGARVAAVLVASSAMSVYSAALTRITTTAAAARTALVSFLTSTMSGARATAVSIASSAMSVYSAAIARITAVAGAATARVAAFLTAAASGTRVTALMAATTAMAAYRAAMLQLRTVAASAGTAMGRFYTAIRTQVISAATTAQRLYNRSILDARIAMATAQVAVGRWFTAFRTSTISVAAAAQSAYTATVARLTGIVSAATAGVSRLAGSISLSSIAAATATRAVAVYSGTLGVFSAASSVAATAAGRFATAVGSGIATAAVGSVRALSSLTMFLGGPWGIALLAATLLIFDFTMKAADQRAKNEQLRDSLLELGEAYRSTDGGAEQAVQSMIKQNRAIRDLILNAEKFGLTIDDVVRATEGDVVARERVIDSYNTEIDRLQKLMSEYKDAGGVFADSEDKRRIAREAGVKDAGDIYDRVKALQAERDAISKATGERARANEAGELVRQANIDAQRAQQALNEAMKDGAKAADILRQAYKSLYGDAQSREEAIDAERAAYDRLRASVEKNGATLDANTAEGRENRENMRDRIQTLADLAAADIAATGTISADTQERIDKLRAELIQMGFNQAEVDKMIKLYMGVPPKILTEIILNGGANAQGQLNEVGKKALEMIATYNLSPSDAMIIAKGGIPPGWRGPSPSALAQAEGGHIRGPGTETSDSIPALLSDNEFVEPAHAVRHYGPQLFEALRQHRVPKEMLPGYVRGGLVDSTGVRRMAAGGWTGVGGRTHSQRADVTTIPSWQMLKDYNKKLLADKLQELETNYRNQFVGGGDPGDVGAGPGFPPWPSAPPGRGGPSGDSGVWKSILNLVRQAGIPYNFGNAFRRGDPLWHGAGRAIDFMGYNQDRLAQFFTNMRPRVLELIHWTNTAKYGITRGRPATMNTQGPLHRNHLHVAMDDGGWLRPGWNSIFNGLGKPEAVLTPPQSAALVDIARNGMGGGYGPRTVNNIHFLDTTLDAGKLHAMNRAEAVYSRSGRAR